MSENLELNLSEPESDDYVKPEDIFIKRNEDGDVLPVEEEAKPFGKVLVRPLTYGRIEELQNTGQLEKMEAQAVADLLKDQYVKPDLSELTAQRMKDDMPALAPQILLLALFKASGVTGDVEISKEGEATVSLEGN